MPLIIFLWSHSEEISKYAMIAFFAIDGNKSFKEPKLIAKGIVLTDSNEFLYPFFQKAIQCY